MKSGVGVCSGGFSVFVLEVLCKHVFFMGVYCNYGFPSMPLSLC